MTIPFVYFEHVDHPGIVQLVWKDVAYVPAVDDTVEANWLSTGFERAVWRVSHRRWICPIVATKQTQLVRVDVVMENPS